MSPGAKIGSVNFMQSRQFYKRPVEIGATGQLFWVLRSAAIGGQA